jgi:hypothetical protein
MNSLQINKPQYYFLLLSVFVLCSCSPGSKKHSSSFFEGNIKFKNEYIIKSDKVTPEQLDRSFGKTADLYFKEGNYLEIYDGGLTLNQLYRRLDNKTYVKKDYSDSLFWFNCAQSPQQMIRYEMNRKKETILGIVCDEYITYYDNKTVTFYFNSDTLKLDPEWYSQFTLTNKNTNTAIMKSMYLKFKIEYSDFLFTVTATSMNYENLDSKMFDIEKNAILIKDPSYN